MALGAMANDPNLKVKIVPVGLSYFHPHLFRSRAVVEFGSAMDVPEQFVEMFKEGGNSKREAVSKLLDHIYDGLKTVTIRAPDYDTLMVSRFSTGSRFTELTFTPVAHPSRTPLIQVTWRALDSGPSRRAEQAVPRSLCPSEGRATSEGASFKGFKIQSTCSRSWTA